MTCPASTKPYMDLVSFSIFPCIGASLQPIGALFRYHIPFDISIYLYIRRPLAKPGAGA